MNRNWLRAFCLVTFGVVQWTSPPASPATETGTLEPPVLVDRWGVEHLWSTELTEFPERPARAYVVIFLDVNCPIVTRSAPTLNELCDRFLPENVQLLGIYSNERQSRMQMAAHKQKLDLKFPTFLDVGGRLARLLGARVTPEAFVLDSELRTRYRGMIDDSGWKKSPTTVKTEYLADAIAGLLAAKSFVAETRAQGCELQLPPLRRPLPKQLLTYHDDVAPIIHGKCVSCHYPGGIGPFALHDFESVRDEAATIRREVEYQRMPPWHADGSRGRPIQDVAALTDVERRTIVDWIEQGFARREAGEAEWLAAGAPPAVPLPLPDVPAPGEFKIGGGRPDTVVGVVEPFTVPASTRLEYQYFWIPNDFTEDRYVQAIEALPGDRRVVHHLQVFLVDKKRRPDDVSKPQSGALMMAMVNGFVGGSSRRIASYTPGDQYSARTFAPDEGIYFPAGFDLVLEVHYTAIDEPVRDQSQVGIVWRKTAEPPTKLICDQLLTRGRNVEILPYASHVRSEFEPYFKQSVFLIDVRPHMHLRGSDAQLFAVYPDGREELLLTVPAYDFNWQRRYMFEQPVRLPAGSSLRFIGHWDNGRLNPHNPNPGATILYGEDSYDEMSNVGATYRVDDEAEQAATRKVISSFPR